MVLGCTTELSARAGRSSSCTVDPTSTTTTCFPSSIDSRTRSASSTTTSADAGGPAGGVEPDEVSIRLGDRRPGQRAAPLRTGLRCGARALVGWRPGDGVRDAPSRSRVAPDPRQHGAGVGRATGVIFREDLLPHAAALGDVERMQATRIQRRATRRGISRRRPRTTGSTSAWRCGSPSTSSRSIGAAANALHRGERARGAGDRAAAVRRDLRGQTGTT